MRKHVSRNRAHGFGFSRYRGKYAAKKPDPIVRTLCIALACVMVMSLLVSGIAFQGANAATASSGQCGADLWWEFKELTGTLTIKGQGDMWDFERPEEAPWAGFTDSIRKIVFLSGVTAIGKNAFVGCSVKTVEFPDTLTVIRESAFQNCGKLVKADASQTQLVTVEARAFSGCWGLRMESLSMPESAIYVDNTAFDKVPAEQPATPPVVQPTEPVVEPTKPVEEPTAPSEEPTKPIEEPTEPAVEPTEPAEEPTEPAVEPTEPAEEPTEPAVEPTEPAEEPTEPAVEPTEPVEKPTEPAEQPTEPAEEPTKPTKKPYKIKEYGTDGNLIGEKCYDANGNMTEESSYNTDGNLMFTNKYDATTGALIYEFIPSIDNIDRTYDIQYDEAGRLIKVTYSFHIGGETSYLVDEYKYDETGKVIEWSYDPALGTRVYVKNIYDSNDNLIEQRFFEPGDTSDEGKNPDGSFMVYKYDREFDELGNLVSYTEKHCNAGGDCTAVQINEYQYDEAGNLVEEVISMPVNNRSTSYKYEFDDEGRQTGYSCYDSDGNLTRYGVIECDTASAEALTEPTEEATEPTEETTEEAIEPTEEASNPTVETTDPTVETTDPTEETTEPSEEATEPSDETMEPTEATTEPTEETTESIEEAA